MTFDSPFGWLMCWGEFHRELRELARMVGGWFFGVVWASQRDGSYFLSLWSLGNRIFFY
jgi:hypothetical protein